jgi:hypothetical protein
MENGSRPVVCACGASGISTRLVASLVLRNPNKELCGQIPNIALRAIVSLYIELVPLIWKREEKEARGSTLYLVSRVFLLTGGNGVDLVIRGDIVLNTLSARSTSTLLRDQICINSTSTRQVSGLAELSYATGFDSPSTQLNGMFTVLDSSDGNPAASLSMSYFSAATSAPQVVARARSARMRQAG